ncbi:TNF receptor-associated factor 5-like [Halichondria panicea]|uniref:TNF receptor-associated factor 5-like n=1 Tax=Halichondria panicea TaxID=6063 RepID=UPI00312B87B2
MASLQLSGYTMQCEFVESVKDYECPLCLHVTREPSLTSCCGQHFCQACIQTILTDNKPCPFCKENSFTTLLDKKQQRRVLDLKVYCDNKANDCDWVGGLGELEQHLGENCQLVFVDCQYNCGEAIERRFLSKHTTNDCPKRPHSCNYCLIEGTYQEIQDDHLPVCSKYLVECPNECRVALLERGQLERHLRECPLAMVECELKELGCEEVVQRKDADKHMEQAAQKHLRLSTSYFIKNQKRQDEKIANLQEDINAKLREKNEELIIIDNLRQRYGKLEEELESKSKELLDLSSQIDTLTQHVGVSVTNVTVDYIKEKVKVKRWINSYDFRTVPTGYIMKVNLYFTYESGRIEFELTPVNTRANVNLKWPKTFTMTVTMLNQTGDHSHYQITKDLEVTRGDYNDQLRIDYDSIDYPPLGVRYIVNGHIKFKIIASEKIIV